MALSSAEETLWLLAHSDFIERPATIEEFLDEKYLNIKDRVRPGIKKALEDIFGDGVPGGQRIALVEAAMVTGAIGIGKTTLASIALPYMVHWVLCLKDPQGFYQLLPGSRIAFMQMSTSEGQAREVIFGDIKARVDSSPWFKKWPYDKKYTKQIRFDKDIWILPGDSAETTFEGYNILGGILDEADSHKVTQEKDYAEQGYNTIESRIASRFVDNTDPEREGHRGLLIVIGQMKKANGFAARKYKELKEDTHAHVVRMTLWESFGWDKYMRDGERLSFWYDVRRREIMHDWVGEQFSDKDQVMEIPRAFLRQFKLNPEKALRDLAGIPPTAEDPFISMPYKLEEAEERWVINNGDLRPVGEACVQPELAEWVGTREYTDARKRVAHLDIGYSENGDAAGIAVGHVKELVEAEDGDLRPYMSIDILIRFKAAPGGEVYLSDLRRVLYILKDRGMRLEKVTMDGFQSIDTRQQLRKRKFLTDYLSIDKDKGPYEDLREAIYEDRIEWPPYITVLSPGSAEKVNILQQELLGLTDTGRKIDHPKDGSKDVADSVAGVVHTLMGDKRYRRGLSSTGTPASSAEQSGKTLDEILQQFDNTQPSGPLGMPTGGGMTTGTSSMGLYIPDRLRP